MRFFVSPLLLGLLASCGYLEASKTLPLCPKLAAQSGSEEGSYVNLRLAEFADRHGIEIEELSSFAAIYTSSSRNLEKLVENYPTLVCSFDPKIVVSDDDVYTACMANAPRWMTLLEEGNGDNLFLPSSKYYGSCSISEPS